MLDKKNESVNFYIEDRGQKADEVRIEAALLRRKWEEENSGELRDPSFMLDHVRGHWVVRYRLIHPNSLLIPYSARFGDSA